MELGGQSSQVMNTFRVLAGVEAETEGDNVLFCGLEVRERSFVGRGRSSRMSSHNRRSTKIEQGVFPGVFYQDCVVSSWIFWILFQHYLPSCFPPELLHYLMNVDRCHSVFHLKAK